MVSTDVPLCPPIISLFVSPLASNLGLQMAGVKKMLNRIAFP